MIKLSNSSCDTYKTCPKKYYLQYVEKINVIKKSSPLVLGTAFDQAFNDILLNVGKLSEDKLITLGINSFNAAWIEQEDRYSGKFKLAKNPNISYSKKDFEEGILTEEDGEDIDQYFEELKPTFLASNPEYPFDNGYELFQYLRENSKDFNHFSEEDKSFYNYVVWLSIKRKAPYIISAYVKELVPKIKEVVSVQKNLNTKDADGNLLTGVADFIVKLKPGVYGSVTVGDEPIIADNKTSSKPYTADSVATSGQLAKYKVILNEEGLPVQKGAYFVVMKELVKTQNKTCESCGYKSTASHKTCDNKINGKRCGGEWNTVITFSAKTQLVVDNISDEYAESAMQEIDNVICSIKEGNFEPNLEACGWQFGAPCPFYNLCHNNSMEGLVKQEKKLDKK